MVPVAVQVGDSVSDNVIIVSPRVCYLRKVRAINDPFPEEIVSVKKCRPRVGDRFPDRELSSTESSTPSVDDVKSEKFKIFRASSILRGPI